MLKILKFLFKSGIVLLAVIGIFVVVGRFLPNTSGGGNQSVEVIEGGKHNVNFEQEIGTYDIETELYRWSDNVYVKNWKNGDWRYINDFEHWLKSYDLSTKTTYTFDFLIYTDARKAGNTESKSIQKAKIGPTYQEQLDDFFSKENLDQYYEDFKENIYKFPLLVKKLYENCGEIARKFLEDITQAFQGFEPPAEAQQ